MTTEQSDEAAFFATLGVLVFASAGPNGIAQSQLPVLIFAGVGAYVGEFARDSDPC
jgi:hypothetical protein